MKKLFFLLLLPTFAQAQQAPSFQLKGDLKLTQPVDWVYLNYNNGDTRVADSTQLKNGSFTFNGQLTEPTVASLVVKYQAAGDARPRRESMNLMLEPVKMNLLVRDSLKSNSVSVTGSAAHLDFTEVQKQVKPYTAQLPPLYEAYEAARKENRTADLEKIEHSIEAIDEQIKEKVYLNFIKTRSQSPAALFFLNQYAGWDFDPNEIEPLLKSLPPAAQKSPSGVRMQESITLARKTAVGSYAMEFTQNDTLDRPVSLSSFKGKYLLVDFWASWCGPCRQENPNVVKAYQRFKDRNFAILGVSLDREGQKDRWMKAIHDDGLTWTHVSDLKFWNNAVAKQYGIRAIPQNLLLDPQGKIIARNLSGSELEEKLAEMIK